VGFGGTVGPVLPWVGASITFEGPLLPQGPRRTSGFLFCLMAEVLSLCRHGVLIL
jgi:hypothetical protein